MAKKITVKSIHESSQDDAKYWVDKSPQERLNALEQIRSEFHRWKYQDAEPRLQRVYRIIKRPSG